jgi:hypothetical protein
MGRKTVSRSSRTSRAPLRKTPTTPKTPKEVIQQALKRETKRIAEFLRASSVFWHREAARLLTPQAVPTPKSREAAARAMVLQDAAENVERKTYLAIGDMGD